MKRIDITTMDSITDEQDIYLYGSGEIAQLVIPVLFDRRISPKGVFDKDEQKQGNVICNVPVISPRELASVKSNSVIFITSTYFNAISTTIKSFREDVRVYDPVLLLGESMSKLRESSRFSSQDLVEAERCYYAMDKKVDIYLKVNSNKIVMTSVDVVVTERCSMKCVDCSNLMQYFVKPINVNSITIKKSLDLLMKSVDLVNELRIIGGEPFMVKDLHEIVKFCANYENTLKVIIYTNGTIVPREEQISSFQNDKVYFEITNYKSLSRNLHKLKGVFDANGIGYKVKELPLSWDDCGDIENYGWTEPQLDHIFRNCCASNLVSLIHGSLYRCPFSSSLDALNVVDFSPSDKLNLLDRKEGELVSRDELQSFLFGKKYLESCRYCQGRGFEFERVTPAVQTKKPKPLKLFQKEANEVD